MTYWESIERASSFYLYETIVDEEKWEDMTERQRDDWLTEHAWQPFEDWTADSLWELIKDLAGEFREVDSLARQKALVGK